MSLKRKIIFFISTFVFSFFLSTICNKPNKKIRPLSWIPKEELINVINKLDNEMREKFAGESTEQKVFLNDNKEMLMNLIEPVSPENAAELMAIIERIMIDNFQLENQLTWCPCISLGERLFQIIRLLYDVTHQHSNANKLIVYTSLGAGRLLQDYSTLRELLIAGFKNIEVNLIELEFPYIPGLAKTEEEQAKILGSKPIGDVFQKRAAYKRREQERQALLIDHFKTLLAYVIEQLPEDREIHINIFENAYAYIAKAQKNENDKSDILVMIDPGLDLFEQEYRSSSNVLRIELGENNVVVLFMPIGNSPQVYEKLSENVPKAVQKKMEKMYAIIKSIDFSNDKNYRFQLIQNLIDEGIIPPVLKSDILISKIDPFISFQDLVRFATKPDAIIYLLAKLGDESTPPVRKISRDNFINEDVVTPYNGLYHKRFKKFNKKELQFSAKNDA